MPAAGSTGGGSDFTGRCLDRHRRVAGILDRFRQLLGIGRDRLYLHPVRGQVDL